MNAAEVSVLNTEKVEAFGDKLIGILNSGALGLMISIGHRTGLYDTMRILPPATSQGIADTAGLNERYVREWLGAMVVGMDGRPVDFMTVLVPRTDYEIRDVWDVVGMRGTASNEIYRCLPGELPERLTENDRNDDMHTPTAARNMNRQSIIIIPRNRFQSNPPIRYSSSKFAS